MFANKVLRALHAAGHLSEQDVDNILSWKHSGFSTFVGDPIDPADKQRLLFAARYLKKCPLSNERINIIEHNGTTTIEYRCAKDGTANTRTFDPLQFLAELSQHIPNTWEQTTRHLGAYSCRTRGAARLREPVDDPTKELPEPIVRPSKNWARLMKKVFELNPLLCPKCGAEMVIKAFITDSREIDRIMAACAIQQRAPPKLKYTAPLAA